MKFKTKPETVTAIQTHVDITADEVSYPIGSWLICHEDGVTREFLPDEAFKARYMSCNLTPPVSSEDGGEPVDGSAPSLVAPVVNKPQNRKKHKR